MDELGCFKLTDDFYHPQFRPCNVLPQPRSLINTRFILFTKNNIKQGKFLVASNSTSLNSSSFDSSKPTKFIIHGIQENPLHDPWVLIMMKEILENEDANVIIVDWSRGSYSAYIQAVANARVVGRELASLVQAMETTNGLKMSSVHLIGHSLGAHIAAYASQRLSSKPSRITGLDPSYKFFCNMPETIRLDLNDADFVDVIHTELHGYDSGHGGCHELGHIDFFPNGAGQRPGCGNSWGTATSTHDLYNAVAHVDLNRESYRGINTCRNQRAVALFISSIKPRTCKMIGYTCSSLKAFLRGECSDCGSDGNKCAQMGYAAEKPSTQNSNSTLMYLVAGKFPPFCLYEYRIRMKLNSSQTHQDYSPSGSLLVALKGEKKPLFVHLSFYSAHGGKEYTFLVTTAIDIGSVKNVSVKWEEYGVYEESWKYGQTVFHYKPFNSQVESIYITLLNVVQTGNENKRSVEVGFCKKETPTNNLPGWATFAPGC